MKNFMAEVEANGGAEADEMMSQVGEAEQILAQTSAQYGPQQYRTYYFYFWYSGTIDIVI